jgi:hypothetical protein
MNETAMFAALLQNVHLVPLAKRKKRAASIKHFSLEKTFVKNISILGSPMTSSPARYLLWYWALCTEFWSVGAAR